MLIDESDIILLRRWTARSWVAVTGAGLLALVAGVLSGSEGVAATGKALVLFWGLPLAVSLPVRAARSLLGQINRDVSSR